MSHTDELRVKKKELEGKIFDLLTEFTHDTGLRVTQINVGVLDTTTYGDLSQGKRSVVYIRPDVTAEL